MSIARTPTHGLWKKSATLLLVTPDRANSPNVLMVRRSKNAKFMPNATVFPGGLCEPADFSLDWLQVAPSLKDFSVPRQSSFPELFENDSPSPAQELSPHIGFRINALREFFEETGILLANGKRGESFICDNLWRRKVCENPASFCEMFKELGLSLDISRLHNWSTWLTPTHLTRSPRRYDTQFYVTFLDKLESIPPMEDREVADIKMYGVQDLLCRGIKGQLEVAPPQFYELSRLLALNDLDLIKEYARSRDEIGTERIMPVLITCTDGGFVVFPGDSLYPSEPDWTGSGPPIKIKNTVEECMVLYPHHHRAVFRKGRPDLLINVSLSLQQQPPLSLKHQASKI